MDTVLYGDVEHESRRVYIRITRGCTASHPVQLSKHVALLKPSLLVGSDGRANSVKFQRSGRVSLSASLALLGLFVGDDRSTAAYPALLRGRNLSTTTFAAQLGAGNEVPQVISSIIFTCEALQSTSFHSRQCRNSRSRTERKQDGEDLTA